MSSIAALLSAEISNLMCCKATQIYIGLRNASMSALFKIILTKISIHTVFFSKNLSLTKICSIVYFPKINPPVFEKIPVDSILHLRHPIYQTSCRLSNGFKNTHARLINQGRSYEKYNG